MVPSRRFPDEQRSPLTRLKPAGGSARVPAAKGGHRRVGIADLAAEAWRAIVHAVFARHDYMAGQAARFELTLPQAHLLQMLSKGPARTMATIAEALDCDASNVTGIVDRLVARRLIVRRSARRDRRVRTISLTPQGRSVVSELTRRMMDPPDGFLRLTATDLSSIRSLICRAIGDCKDVTGFGSIERGPCRSKSRRPTGPRS
jgi:MarR family transcriptional regulator, organic hydroperoxide resistance regulator